MIPIKDQQLRSKAFTHRSFLNESSSTLESNERLEYLGDAVLELVVSKHLYETYTDKPEGELTALRAALVKTTTLAQVATRLNLGSQLQMSKGEAQGDGRTNPSLLANTFEAVVGAVFLEGGLKQATDFIGKHLFPLIPTIISNNLHRDYKSTLQELIQAQGLPTPTYESISQQGPDHDKTFEVALIIGSKRISTGHGPSKQKAQKQAARVALKLLEEKSIL